MYSESGKFESLKLKRCCQVKIFHSLKVFNLGTSKMLIGVHVEIEEDEGRVRIRVEGERGVKDFKHNPVEVDMVIEGERVNEWEVLREV